MTNNLQEQLHTKKFKIIATKNMQSIMFDLKKYRGVIFHDTEGDTKVEGKLIKGSQSLKIGILMGSFNPK